jgi:hypothetical protein
VERVGDVVVIWSWVPDEVTESTGSNSLAGGERTRLTAVRWVLVVRSSSTGVTKIGYVE